MKSRLTLLRRRGIFSVCFLLFIMILLFPGHFFAPEPVSGLICGEFYSFGKIKQPFPPLFFC